MLAVALTFDLPCAGGTPAGAHTNETDREGLGVRPGKERDGFAFVAGGDDASVPPYPESAEFAPVQNTGSIELNFLGFAPVFPDDTL